MNYVDRSLSLLYVTLTGSSTQHKACFIKCHTLYKFSKKDMCHFPCALLGVWRQPMALRLFIKASCSREGLLWIPCSPLISINKLSHQICHNPGNPTVRLLKDPVQVLNWLFSITCCFSGLHAGDSVLPKDPQQQGRVWTCPVMCAHYWSATR